MRRGTTPLITINMQDDDWSQFQTVHLTLSDGRCTIVDKMMEDLTFSVDGDGNNIITCRLSQEDTLCFHNNSRVKVQVRGVDGDNVAHASDIEVMRADEVLLNRVIDPDWDAQHGHETHPQYACTIELGTVETLPAGQLAYITNIGTNRNAVFNFGIPRGANGQNGQDGRDGHDGRDGQDGTDGQDGVDGITPTVSTTAITGGHNVAFSYGADDPRNTNFDVMDGQDGADGADGQDGTDGVDGITPTVAVTSITGGHNVAFSYGSGDSRNTDFDVMDGQDGQDGAPGQDGQDGSDGSDGADGITPTVAVTSITGGHNVAFSYGSGDSRNTNFDVMDGVDGANGQNGQDGADGQNATVAVGTVTTNTGTPTTSVSVSNSGTASAAVLDFTFNLAFADADNTSY